MSEALDRVCDLRRAGFGLLPHYDEHGEMVALQALRVRAGHIETVLIHGEHDALAPRCRDDEPEQPAHVALALTLAQDMAQVACA